MDKKHFNKGAFREKFAGMERIANSMNGGRARMQGYDSIDKYSDPNFIAACRNDAKRNIVIWARS